MDTGIHFEALEPRLLLSGTTEGIVAEIQLPDEDQSNQSVVEAQNFTFSDEENSTASEPVGIIEQDPSHLPVVSDSLDESSLSDNYQIQFDPLWIPADEMPVFDVLEDASKDIEIEAVSYIADFGSVDSIEESDPSEAVSSAAILDDTDPDEETEDTLPGEDIAPDSALILPEEESEILPDSELLATDGVSDTTDESIRNELVFVNDDVADYDQLAEDLLTGMPEGRDITLVTLDSGQDGIEQISSVLSESENIDAVHFVSHGTDRSVKLGGTWLQDTDLDTYSEDIAGWGNALTGDADLVFYGCNLAGGDRGRELLETIGELTDADVAASTDNTGNAIFGADWDLEYTAGNIETSVVFSDQFQENWIGLLAGETVDSFWISTLNDVTGGGSPGIDTWEDGEAIELGDPNLTLGTASDGTFSSIIDLDDFAASDTRLNAIHYVTNDITVGSVTSIDLLAGDVLLSTTEDETIGGTAFNDEDVFAFRPDTFGDYSAGTFFMLIDGSDIGLGGAGEQLNGVTLIEQDTVVAGTTFDAGTFLLSSTNGFADILHYDFTSVGTTTAGSSSTFLDLSDIDINDNSVDGLDLVETDIDVGGVSLTSGQLLVYSFDDADAGDNALAKTNHDIFVLDITSTGTTSAATATMFFDGSDVSLDTVAEELTALSLVFINDAPTVTPTGADLAYTEDDGAVAVDDAITVDDVDDTNLESATIQITGNYLDTEDELGFVNQNGITGVWDVGTGTFTLTGSSSVDNYQTALQSITYTNSNNTDPDSNTRTVTFTVNDGDTDSAAATRDITVTAVTEITARETIDSDGDGQIDQIKITTDVDLDDDFSGMTMTVSGYTVTGYSSDIANDAVFYVDLTESGTADTDATPTVTVTANTTLSDDGGTDNVAVIAGVAATDTAAPVMLVRETADLDNDGFIDAIHVTFSEAIDDSTVIANDWDVAGVVGETFVWNTNGDTADDADIYLTFNDGVLDSTSTPDLTYTPDESVDADVQDLAGVELGATESWWDASWLNRTQITFDNSAQTENLTDFPVLVSLTSSNVDFDKIKADGADIRFIDRTTGNALSYEIEDWDDGAETATIWVEMPQIDGSSDTDYIWMYYNNAAAADAQDAAGVWDPNHEGVWHMGDGITDDNVVSNSNPITILDNAQAGTYPSTINVSGLTGTVTNVTVTITGFSHTYPDDVDMLLVGPQGQTVMLMSDQGGGQDETNVDLTFDDDAASDLPTGDGIETGTYRPRDDAQNDSMDAPAPGGPYGTTLSAFDGQNPNGDWKLYVMDDAGNDAGSISGGWSLTITTSADILDSVNNYDGTNNGSTGTTGRVADGQDFDGTDDFIDFASTDVGDTFTISAWIKPDSTGTGIQTIAANSVQGNLTDGFRFFINSSGTEDGKIVFETANGASSNSANTAVGVINFDQWNYLAVEVDRVGGTATIYHNGVDVTDDGTIRTDFNTVSDWEIGRMEGTLEYKGIIDEFRIESAARSADWVAAQYASMNLSFNTYSAEQSVTTVHATTDGANDPPTVTPTVADLAYTENDGAVTVDGSITVSDADDTNLESATVQITGNYVPGGEDTLSFTNQNGITGTWTAATGTLALSGSATKADYQTALRSITYTNSSDDPDTSTRTVSFTVNDGTIDSTTGTRDITVAAVNDAPIFSTTVENPTFAEGSAPSLLYSSTNIDLVEAGDLVDTLTMTIEGLQNGADEILSVDGTDVALTNGNNVTTAANSYVVDVSVTGDTATVTMTKAGGYTAAAAETLVDGLAYQNTSNDPQGATRTATLTLIQDDGGTANGGDDDTVLSAASTSPLDIVGVNDAPVLSATADDPTFTEGGAAAGLFSSTNINLVEAGDRMDTLTMTVAGLQNGADEILSVDGTDVALTDGNSVTTVANSYVVDVSVAGGTATVTMTKVGGYTAAAAQTLVDGLAYENTSNDLLGANRTATLTLIKDDGGTALGGDDDTVLSVATTVTLAAANDAPIASDATLTVAEDASNGAVVGTVSASDPDTGDTLTYSITAGNGDGIFAINSTTGQITVTDNSNLNYDSATSYNLTVQVEDPGGLTNTAAITVNVTDVNYSPIATDATFSVAEDAADGTVLGTVTATDPDAGDTKTYSITAGNGDGIFAINSSTGEITAADNSKLNYDSATSHSLTVQVEDAGGLTDTATVTVNVTDVNKEPTVSNASFSIDEHSADGSAVGTIIASDPDAGDSLTYSIIAGNDQGLFSINGSTGAITVNNGIALDFEVDPTYTLTIRVADSGSPALSETATVTINLNDIFEAAAVEPDPEKPEEAEPDDTTLSDDTGANNDLTEGDLARSAIDDEDPTDNDQDEEEDPEFETETVSENATEGIVQESLSDSRDESNAISRNKLTPDRRDSKAKPSVKQRKESKQAAEQKLEEILLINPKDRSESSREFDSANEASEFSAISSGEKISAPAKALIANKTMQRELDAINDQIDETVKRVEGRGKLIAGTAMGISAFALGGYVLWAFRGISLLASTFASLPVWQFFDPLPVLSDWEGSSKNSNANGKDDDESIDEEEKKLQTIFDK